MIINYIKHENIEDAIKHVKDQNISKVYFSDHTYLNFSFNILNEESCSELAEILRQTNINEIECYCDSIENTFGIQYLMKALDSSKVTRLKLSVKDSIASPVGLTILAEGLRGTNVTTLDLNDSKISSDGLSDLAEGLRGTKVTILSLYGNKIDDEGLSNLTEGLVGTEVTTLDLGNNQIGDKGLNNLAKALVGTKITILNLGGNQMSSEGLINLAKGLRGTEVTTLDLGHNQIGDEVLSNLAKALVGTKVTTLGLNGNEISDEVLSNLAEGLRGTEVTTLDLNGNEISDEGLAGLAKGLRGTKVTILSLNGNEISDEGLAGLAEGLRGTKVTTLNISDNEISIEGAKNLAKGLRGTEVTTLDLGYNDIDDEGVRDLAEVLCGTKVTTLDLSYIRTCDQGVRDLAQGLLGTHVKTLTIREIGINAQGAMILAEGLRNTEVTTLNLGNNNILYAEAENLAQCFKGTNITDLEIHFLESNKLNSKTIQYNMQYIIEHNKALIRNKLDVGNINKEYNITASENLEKLYPIAPKLIKFMEIINPILDYYPGETKALFFNEIFKKFKEIDKPISWDNISPQNILHSAVELVGDDPKNLFESIAVKLAAYDRSDSIITPIISELAHMQKWHVVNEIFSENPQYNLSLLLDSNIFCFPTNFGNANNTDAEKLTCINKIIDSLSLDTKQEEQYMEKALENSIIAFNEEVALLLLGKCRNLGKDSLVEYAKEKVKELLHIFSDEQGSDSTLYMSLFGSDDQKDISSHNPEDNMEVIGDI